MKLVDITYFHMHLDIRGLLAPLIWKILDFTNYQKIKEDFYMGKNYTKINETVKIVLFTWSYMEMRDSMEWKCFPR